MKINSRSIVGLDTQVLIWAFCERDQPDIADLINCSKSIFKFLKKQEARIVISTVTVAEYLVGIDVREHVRTIKILEKHFTIAPFNTRAAMTCAPLFLPSKTLVNEDYTRKVLSADLKVVASLVSLPCRILILQDTSCRNIATRAGMQVFSPLEFDTTEQTEFDLPLPSKKKGNA